MEYDQTWARSVQQDIIRKMDWVSVKNKDKIPYTTDADGNFDDRSDPHREFGIDDGLNWWTNGFWGGEMWLMYQATGEERYRLIAKQTEEKLTECFHTFLGLHHDVGFMFMPTAVANFRLTGSAEAKKNALHAASLLMGRFNPAGSFIRAWNDLPGEDTRGWAIIDCMLNISLLYWASEETGDPRFRQVAMAHADTVMEHFIRKDGSSIHIGVFDPESGAYLRNLGGQGLDEHSSWSRGQGWALYGFVISFLHTGRRSYLNCAQRVADEILHQLARFRFEEKTAEGLRTHCLVPSDFKQPDTPAVEDSCAACVIACGLLELAGLCEESEGEKYRLVAVELLRSITELRADFTHGCDAIVQECAAAYHGNGHHMTMTYADFYYMEAIWKLNGTGIFMW